MPVSAGSHVLTGQAIHDDLSVVWSVCGTDVDVGAAVDVLGAACCEDEVAWWANTAGALSINLREGHSGGPWAEPLGGLSKIGCRASC